ncbi:MAG: oxaloacetate decarboxylase [Desulfovibrio sp.]|jgi:methylisocitrate lyase|nr:oxaloacetate decarboxylase [Desulfovibrio sp.]
MKKTTALRNLLAKEGIIVAPGATTALFAYLVELAGFDVVYATGAGIANMNLGVPDIGLATMTENLEVVKRMNDATRLPVFADIDNGYGNSVMVYRTVKEFTACGIAGLQLEDQRLPKRCGHFEGKAVISKEEMVSKIKAAKDAMLDPDTVLMARTDAISVNGFEDAVDRANAYREAGADLLFVEAPTSREMLREIPRRVPGLHTANMVEGGKTPPMRNSEMEALGFKFVLYANAPLKAAVKGVKDLLEHLKTRDGTGDAAQLMIPMTERNRITNFDFYRELETRFKA